MQLFQFLTHWTHATYAFFEQHQAFAWVCASSLVIFLLIRIVIKERHIRHLEPEERWHYPEGENWYDEAHHYVKDHINNSEDFNGYM